MSKNTKMTSSEAEEILYQKLGITINILESCKGQKEGDVIAYKVEEDEDLFEEFSDWLDGNDKEFDPAWIGKSLANIKQIPEGIFALVLTKSGQELEEDEEDE